MVGWIDAILFECSNSFINRDGYGQMHGYGVSVSENAFKYIVRKRFSDNLWLNEMT